MSKEKEVSYKRLPVYSEFTWGEIGCDVRVRVGGEELVVRTTLDGIFDFLGPLIYHGAKVSFIMSKEGSVETGGRQR